MSHALKMILGCTLPLLLLFVLPLLGIGDGVTLFVAILPRLRRTHFRTHGHRHSASHDAESGGSHKHHGHEEPARPRPPSGSTRP